ncbi:MAG: ABC transporter permease subunit [Candidatus Latescibacterota bacterium]
MGTVFLHQLRDHLRSLRFPLGLLVLLLFFLANGIVYAWKVQRVAEEAARIQADDDRLYGEPRTVSAAADLFWRVLSHPLGTEFIAEAGLNWFDDSAWLGVASERRPLSAANSRTLNNWMLPFEIVDWALVVRLVLSFLCVVLAYDAVSGEQESGTLRLVLANPLSRGRFLVGKFLGHLTALLAATLVGALVSLLVLSLSGVPVLGCCLLFLLGTVLYLTFFLFVAMGVSAVARRSSSALVLLVLVWAVVIVIVPQTSYMAGAHFAEASGNWWWQAEDVVRQARQRLAGEGISLRDPELGRADGYALEQRYARGMQAADQEQARITLWAHEQSMRQCELARTVNLLSPGFAFQYSVEAFLGAGPMRLRSFLQQALRHRDALRASFQAQDAADPASPHLLFYPAFLSRRDLDPQLVPAFREERLSLAEGVRQGLVPIVVLVLEAAAAFFFALWAVNRAQITE